MDKWIYLYPCPKNKETKLMRHVSFDEICIILKSNCQRKNKNKFVRLLYIFLRIILYLMRL